MRHERKDNGRIAVHQLHHGHLLIQRQHNNLQRDRKDKKDDDEKYPFPLKLVRRKAVSAHLVGDRKTVISCARQINRVVEADKRRRERLSSKKGRPTPKQKPVQKKKNTGSGYDAEYRRFREQFMRDVNDPKKIREADRLAFFRGTQIILENN